MAKRKRSSISTADADTANGDPLPAMTAPIKSQLPTRKSSARGAKGCAIPDAIANGIEAVNESPSTVSPKTVRSLGTVSNAVSATTGPSKKPRKPKATKATPEVEATPATPAKAVAQVTQGIVPDPEADEGEEAGEEELHQALSRPPPVNSDYVPLPWKGRLGFACLNTYLRYSHPPVFSSRTCRIASIIEHRHPLVDPSQPEHATKNRPDKEQPADIARGRKWVEAIGLQNARDIIKMVRWNDKYGIRFMRLSSEMFPFASHDEYGYKLAPFASEVLAEAGKVIAELGHRVTTHPGQFTQLGSPRKQVVVNALRDLAYHDEMLSLLRLPPQQNRDAVMILHMGGVFGSKPDTLDRFRENYAQLPQSVKNRLVLENDDVSWTVHDLLPVCQELNIPMVLDYHHHNIMFDETKIREGTKDIIEMYPEIRATWTRKGITQKMHYSEPCPGAITGRQRRKHSPRVMTLPPCADDMDLMIEAKDKEQAVFELMRTFKLPGFEKINDMIPYTRNDDNRLLEKNQGRERATPKKKRAKKAATPDEALEEAAITVTEKTEQKPVPEEEIGMGGPENRVYWHPTMEEWLRPKKREIKKKDPAVKTPKKRGASLVKAEAVNEVGETEVSLKENTNTPAPAPAKKTRKTPVKVKKEKSVPTPSTSSAEGESNFEKEEDKPPAKKARTAPLRTSRRSTRVDYGEDE